MGGRTVAGGCVVVLALLACKGGGGEDGTYVGDCSGTVQWDFDLPVPHQCTLTLSGSNVKLELNQASSPQYPRYVCSGTRKGDKVEGTCPILDGRGQAGVSHCLEDQKVSTFTVRKQGENMFFEVSITGKASPSTCPPSDEKLHGYRLTGDLPKKK